MRLVEQSIGDMTDEIVTLLFISTICTHKNSKFVALIYTVSEGVPMISLFA
jgi:hypothetical protein